ncbi:MAG: hypothetical protein H6825_02335 [Planctomycetes bacterium]|nr:hypothetical protein [Planctomycetota bacterium]
MKIRPHKVGSVVSRVGLGPEVEVSRLVEAKSGQVLVVRALEEKRVYDVIELTTGRMAHVSQGDVLVGALGRRDALRGFVGRVPTSIKAGDVLHILNLGGVLGEAVSENKDVGHPLRVEVLGMATRNGRGLNIADFALPVPPDDVEVPPVIAISGTCMNAGKTSAACELVTHLTARGYAVGGVKLTGVAAQRDTLNMADHGAQIVLSFMDVGLPSTAGMTDVAPVARHVLRAAAQAAPDLDVIIAEMGDGIIGSYGVASILEDEGFAALVASHVLCATDLVAAWGGVEWFTRRGLTVDVVAGPATDNAVGMAYLRDELGIAAANARTDGVLLTDLVEDATFGRVLAAREADSTARLRGDEGSPTTARDAATGGARDASGGMTSEGGA